MVNAPDHKVVYDRGKKWFKKTKRAFASYDLLSFMDAYQ